MRSVNSPPSKTFELYVKTSPTTYVLHPLLTPFSFSTSSNPQKSGWKYGHYASSLLPNMSSLFFFFFKGHRSARKESWGSISTHPTFNMTMSQDTASGRNTSLICVQEARWACTQTGVHSCRRANPAKFSNPSSSSHNAVTMWCDC